jgi:transposase
LDLGGRFGPSHHARIVEEQLNRLDRSLLEEAYRGVGSAAYRPELMLKMVMFETLEGRCSPAQWWRDTRDHQALYWLGRGIQPSRTAWYDFRDRMGTVIQAVHASLIRQAIEEGLVSPEKGVQDGTSFRACASRHRMVNRKTLFRRQAVLYSAIAGERSTATPEELPSWMAGTFYGRLKQVAQYARAAERLDQRIAENAKKPKDKRLPEDRVVVSLSDLDAYPGRDKEKVFCPLYTVQFVVEPNSLLLMAWDVFAQATDTGTLAPMIDRTKAIVGERFKEMIADATYATLLDLQACEDRHVELLAPVQENSFTQEKRAKKGTPANNRAQFTWCPELKTYLCPQKHPLDYVGKSHKRRRNDQFVTEHRFHCSPEHCRGCKDASGCVRDPNKGRTLKQLEGQEILDAHREKMQDPEIKDRYKIRGQVIERAFGDAKRHRNVRQLHGRGLHRATAEVGLLVLAQNILTLHRLLLAHANSEEESG